MADLIAMPLKRPPPHYELTDEPPFGKYCLCESVPCGDDDECDIATLAGIGGYRPYVFLRRFPTERLDKPTLERIKRIPFANGSGIERIFELGRQAGHAFVTSELIEGVGLDQLDARLIKSGPHG